MRLALATLIALATTVGPRPLPLIGTGVLGHACPTTYDIYTAHHVIDKHIPGASEPQHIYFSTPYGVATPVWADKVRDLAKLHIDDEIPRYRVARTGPVAKEKVHWYEFNFHSKKDFLRQDRREAKVLRTVSGHIVFDKGPTNGASGSCLLNEKEEVVGIVIWSFAVRSKSVGVAVSIVNE